MALLGAHMSIAGGYYKAVDAAAKFGMNVVQLFTKNNTQWAAKPISDEDVSLFRGRMQEHKLGASLSHCSYLINLASPNDELWKKSIDALVIEVQRAALLGVPHVVFHPGAFTTSSEEAGLTRIAKAVDEAHKQAGKLGTQMLLETTAGQGSDLGWRFEHLAEIMSRAKCGERLGVCIDTCHIFAAGYALGTEKEYKATFRQFDKVIGLDRIRAFHVNDSKKPLGSRRDRHEHIGRGCLGLEPFRFLLNDRRFRKIPMYLETAKEVENGEEMDAVNLRTLRSLVKRAE